MTKQEVIKKLCALVESVNRAGVVAAPWQVASDCFCSDDPTSRLSFQFNESVITFIENATRDAIGKANKFKSCRVCGTKTLDTICDDCAVELDVIKKPGTSQIEKDVLDATYRSTIKSKIDILRTCRETSNHGLGDMNRTLNALVDSGNVIATTDARGYTTYRVRVFA